MFYGKNRELIVNHHVPHTRVIPKIILKVLNDYKTKTLVKLSPLFHLKSLNLK